MFGLNTRKQEATPAELPITLRKDWQWKGTEKLDAREIVDELHWRTIEFTEENSLDWAITTFMLPVNGLDVEIKVALTPENQIEFAVGSLTTFDKKQAVRWVKALRSQELVF